MRKTLLAAALLAAMSGPALGQTPSQPVEPTTGEKILLLLFTLAAPQCVIGTSLDALWTAAGGTITEDSSRPNYKACPVVLGPAAPAQPQFPDPE